MRRKIINSLLIISLIFIYGCIPKYTVTDDVNSLTIYDVLNYPFSKPCLIYDHLIADSVYSTRNNTVKPGYLLGHAEIQPLIKSSKHQAILDIAKRYYSQQNYEMAIKLLEPTVQDEPENVFLLNELARCYFWINSEKNKSFNTYLALINLLDAELESETDCEIINLWFADAYWKFACLQLDRHEYKNAIYYISKACAAGLNRDDPTFEQALSYLTEAHFYLKNYQISKFLGNYTLELYPDNQYVIPYLYRIPEIYNR